MQYILSNEDGAYLHLDYFSKINKQTNTVNFDELIMELSAFLHLGLVALDEDAEKVGGLRFEHQPQLSHANRERFFRVQRQLTQFVLKAGFISRTLI